MKFATKAVIVAAILTASTASSAESVPAPSTPPTVDEFPVIIPGTHIHIISGDSTLRTTDGHLYTVPNGSHILTENEWTKVDNEMIRLQNAETNLTTQNIQLRQTVSGWRPGWVTVLVAVGTGIAAGSAAGWYLHDRF